MSIIWKTFALFPSSTSPNICAASIVYFPDFSVSFCTSSDPCGNHRLSFSLPKASSPPRVFFPVSLCMRLEQAFLTFPPGVFRQLMDSSLHLLLVKRNTVTNLQFVGFFSLLMVECPFPLIEIPSLFFFLSVPSCCTLLALTLSHTLWILTPRPPGTTLATALVLVVCCFPSSSQALLPLASLDPRCFCCVLLVSPFLPIFPLSIDESYTVHFSYCLPVVGRLALRLYLVCQLYQLRANHHARHGGVDPMCYHLSQSYAHCAVHILESLVPILLTSKLVTHQGGRIWIKAFLWALELKGLLYFFSVTPLPHTPSSSPPPSIYEAGASLSPGWEIQDMS